MNHAPIGAPKAELGPQRDPAFVLGELARGWLALDRVLGRDGWAHVLVPPHNRIAPALAAALPAAGYLGLSAGMTARPAGMRHVVNTHVDIMDWSTRAFAGEAASLAALIDALRAHRSLSWSAANARALELLEDVILRVLVEVDVATRRQPTLPVLHKLAKLTRGVAEHRAGLDEKLAAYLDRTIEQVDPIERAVLRIATLELRDRLDVPYRVILNEAIEIAKRFGSDHGHTYVNGVLDQAAGIWRQPELNARRG
jgi:transcription antitermination factor NusB